MRARSLFYGTPEVSVQSLRALSEITEVVGVICQPDRPQGRGLNLKPPPVKVAASELGLEVYQPERVKDGALLNFVTNARADLAVVIAYGRILPAQVLSAPRLGSLNLHASLLPALRGAAPIPRAIMLGLKETGVCLMQMDEGLDTGPVLTRHTLTISDQDDTQSLTEKVAALAAFVVKSDIPRLLRGELHPEIQDSSLATYAAPITRADTRLNLQLSAEVIRNQVRGLSPRPGAEVMVSRAGQPERRLKILEARVVRSAGGVPGAVTVQAGVPLIETGEGALEVVLGQADGKKPSGGENLVRGRVLLPGDVVS